MKIEDLGFDDNLKKYRSENGLDGFDAARVISEHKERYIVKTSAKEYEAEILGNLRFSATSRREFPAVGDWAAVSEYDQNKVLIHAVYPRKTILERKAAGKTGEKQIIATNIDYAFILQSVNRDFSINRMERYLSICHAAKIEPVLIVSKVDLITEGQLTEVENKIRTRIKNTPFIFISNETQSGYEQIDGLLEKGNTYCLLGSSGVGKSTLLNNLSGGELMKTGSINESVQRGKHVTSHRELTVLPNGAMFIDNPGMREVGLADVDEGMEMTFNEISILSRQCRFHDCSHIHEKGCAVIQAVVNNELDRDMYDNYLKMLREKEHFDSTIAEKRRKEKGFAKVVKKYKNDTRRNNL